MTARSAGPGVTTHTRTPFARNAAASPRIPLVIDRRTLRSMRPTAVRARSTSTDAIGARTKTSSTSVPSSRSVDAFDSVPPSIYGTPSITLGGYHAGIEQEAVTASARLARRMILGTLPCPDARRSLPNTTRRPLR